MIFIFLQQREHIHTLRCAIKKNKITKFAMCNIPVPSKNTNQNHVRAREIFIRLAMITKKKNKELCAMHKDLKENDCICRSLALMLKYTGRSSMELLHHACCMNMERFPDYSLQKKIHAKIPSEILTSRI